MRLDGVVIAFGAFDAQTGLQLGLVQIGWIFALMRSRSSSFPSSFRNIFWLMVSLQHGRAADYLTFVADFSSRTALGRYLQSTRKWTSEMGRGNTC